MDDDDGEIKVIGFQIFGNIIDFRVKDWGVICTAFVDLMVKYYLWEQDGGLRSADRAVVCWFLLRVTRCVHVFFSVRLKNQEEKFS